MNVWNSDQLWMKAKLFIDHANDHDQGSPEFAFWSALSLECIARSALTKIHPVLNADPRQDVNLLYACGYELTSQPRSLPAHSVYIRLEKTIEGFGKPQRELCDFVALLRNAYLHTAELPYENLTPTRWLPRFYETTKVLNGFLGKRMSDFLGDEVSASAEKLIKALNEEIIGAVKSKIAEHKKVFEGKSEEEQKKLLQASQVAALTVSFGELPQKCPACENDGILSGERVKEFPARYEAEELLVDVQYLGKGFKCACCGLYLKGVEEIVHAGLKTHFTETISTSLHELYEPEYEQEYDNM